MPDFPFTITHCCGRLSLRSGTILCAVYTFIFGGAHIGLSAAWINLLDDGTPLTSTGHLVLNLFIVNVVFYAIWVVSAVFLLIAICTNAKTLLVPWLVYTIVLSIFILIDLISMVASGGYSDLGLNTQTQVSGDIGTIVLNLYALLCVESYRQEAEESHYDRI